MGLEVGFRTLIVSFIFAALMLTSAMNSLVLASTMIQDAILGRMVSGETILRFFGSLFLAALSALTFTTIKSLAVEVQKLKNQIKSQIEDHIDLTIDKTKPHTDLTGFLKN